MYPGYNTQKVLEEARVRDLLENAQPYEPKPERGARGLFSSLRDRIAGLSQPVTADAVQPAERQKRQVSS